MAILKEILEQQKENTENTELARLISALNRYSLEGFVESELAAILQAFDLMIRNSCQNSDAPLHNFAKEISSFFSLWATIPGWQHFSAYLTNPKAYQEEYKRNHDNIFHWNLTTDDLNGEVKLFFRQCQEHLILLVKHAHFIIEKKKREYSFFSSFDPNFKLELLVGELFAEPSFRDWVIKMKEYCTKGKEIVTQLQESNKQNFEEFEKLQSQLNGIYWPHSLQLEKNLAESGFIYRPLLIKRDRYFFETCGHEIAGFFPWLLPESHHDFSKHPPEYKKIIEERLLKRHNEAFKLLSLEFSQVFLKFFQENEPFKDIISSTAPVGVSTENIAHPLALKLIDELPRTLEQRENHDQSTFVTLISTDNSSLTKTLRIVLKPDWEQKEMQSPERAIGVLIQLCPLTETTPQNNFWNFEFNLFNVKNIAKGSKKNRIDEFISQDSRAILMFRGQPFGQYGHAINQSTCRFTKNLEPSHIVFRVDPLEEEPRTLLWVQKIKSTRKIRPAYFKTVEGHSYHLNITFSNSSAIEQLREGLKLTITLLSKKTVLERPKVKYSKIFTNFEASLVQTVEEDPTPSELKIASDPEIGMIQKRTRILKKTVSDNHSEKTVLDTKKTRKEETARQNGKKNKRKITPSVTSVIETPASTPAIAASTPIPTPMPTPTAVPTPAPIPRPIPLPLAITPLQATAEIASLAPLNSLTPLYSLTQSQSLMPGPLETSDDEFALLGEAVFGNKRPRFENTSPGT